MKLPIVILKVLSKKEILDLIEDFFKYHKRRFFGLNKEDLAHSLVNELLTQISIINSLDLLDILSIQKYKISTIC